MSDGADALVIGRIVAVTVNALCDLGSRAEIDGMITTGKGCAAIEIAGCGAMMAAIVSPALDATMTEGLEGIASAVACGRPMNASKIAVAPTDMMGRGPS